MLLLLCATKSAHDFSNLSTFKDIIETCIVYDTGLSKQNKEDIIKHLSGTNLAFINGSFNGSFSDLRNNALNAVFSEDSFTSTVVIMPDDSWSIQVNDIQTLRDFEKSEDEILYCNMVNNGLQYPVGRIFKNYVRFNGSRRNEQLVSTKIRYTDTIVLTDTYVDVERTKKINKFVRPEDFGDLYHAGKWFQLAGDKKLAEECYMKRLEEPFLNEEKFLIYCFMAFMKKDIEYYFKAIDIYADRAGEAYWCLYQVTGNPKYLELARNSPLRSHKLEIRLEIYDLIKDNKD